MKTCPICTQELEDSQGSCPQHPGAIINIDDTDPLIGVIIRDRYQLNEVIGRGAMGVVYKATQTTDGKEVAIKVLHSHLATDAESIKRFQHEAKAASSLMHPNIVRLYDVGMGPSGQPYIAMEFLSGTTLSEYMRGRRHLQTIDALPIIRQVCEALAEAHSHGVLHRDIKPANIMLLNRFGEENFVVVLDFSIAKVIHRVSDVDSTTPGLIFGSPAYMSPERFMGRGGDFRSDIYSMGIIMFQMLAGRAPFKSADLYTLMNEHIGTTPPRVKDMRPDCDIPEELEQVIAKALAKKADDRQENVKQLLSEINEIYRACAEAKAQAKQADKSHLVVAEGYISEDSFLGNDNGNGNGQPVATITRSTPDATFSSSSKPNMHGAESSPNVFGIDPGFTPAIGNPVFQPRKPADEPLSSSALQKSNPELLASGSWGKAHAARNQSQQTMDRSRPAIRPHEQASKFPVEVLALVLVVLVGVGAVVMTQIPNTSDPLPLVIQRKINARELDEASNIMNDWEVQLKPGQEDKFRELELALGKGFLDRKDNLQASRWLEDIPQTSKYWTEARRVSARIHH